MQFFPLLNVSGTEGAGQSETAIVSKSTAAAQQLGQSFADILEDSAKPGVRPEFFQGEGGEDSSISMWDQSRSGLKGFSSGVAGLSFSQVTGATATGDSTAASDLRSVLSGKGSKTKSLKEMSDLKMTREDFAALRDGLVEAGLDESEITALAEKISSTEGLTWGAFTTVLADKLKSLGKDGDVSAIGELASRELQSLFQKVGFNTEEAESLLSDLRSGKTSSVWDAVSTKLASLPAGATIDLNDTELAALASVAKLSGEGATRLMSLMGGEDSATLSAAQLKTVMTTLKSEVAADTKSAKESGKELLNLVNQVLGEAGERAETAEQADGRPDNSIRNQKILAEQSRRERAEEKAEKNGEASAADGDEEGHAERILKADPNTRATVRQAGSGAATVAVAADAADKSERYDALKDGGKDAKDAKIDSKTQELRDALAARTQKGTDTSADTGDEKGDNNASTKDDQSRKAFSELWSKVKVDTSAVRAAAQEAAASQAQVQDLSSSAQQDRTQLADSMVSRWSSNLSGKMMEQVESGLLKNLSEGRKQLTLELNPGDLGKLNVVLQAKDGEVNVMFRAEHQDTSRVLSEQMAQLKTHLENQGIKVGKMEVQTQLQDQNLGQNWQGTDRHNMAQEQQNFIDKRGLWRLLRQDSEPVAQELLSDPATARIAQEGLYVVA